MPSGSCACAVTTTGWLAAGTVGRVGHVVNGRAGIGDVLAVGRARRAEVGGHGHRRGGFEPIAVQTEQRFRPAVQPARLETQRRRSAAGHGVGWCQSDLAGIVAGPDACRCFGCAGNNCFDSRCFPGWNATMQPWNDQSVSPGRFQTCHWKRSWSRCNRLRCYPPDIPRRPAGRFARSQCCGRNWRRCPARRCSQCPPTRTSGFRRCRPSWRPGGDWNGDQSVPGCCRRRRTIRPSGRPCRRSLRLPPRKWCWCRR